MAWTVYNTSKAYEQQSTTTTERYKKQYQTNSKANHATTRTNPNRSNSATSQRDVQQKQHKYKHVFKHGTHMPARWCGAETRKSRSDGDGLLTLRAVFVLEDCCEVGANDFCRSLHQLLSSALRAKCFVCAYTVAYDYGARGLQAIVQNGGAWISSRASPSAYVLDCSALHVDVDSCTIFCVRLKIPSRASRSQLKQVQSYSWCSPPKMGTFLGVPFGTPQRHQKSTKRAPKEHQKSTKTNANNNAKATYPNQQMTTREVQTQR